MQCLAKTPAERPASALALEEALGADAAASEWTVDDARQWWAEHGKDCAARPVGPAMPRR